MKDLKRDALLMLFVLTACCSAQAHMFGPTGIHGNLSGKTIVVTHVDPLGPAGNGLVKAGDVIIGAGGGDSERAPQALFKENVRYEFADAIDAAETEKAGGKLALLLKGEKRVVLQLKVLGSYSDTAPYKCPKSDAIITQAAEYLVKSGQAAGGLHVGLLGLLATGEKKYIDVVRDTVRGWAPPDMSQLMAAIKGDTDMGYVAWYWGYNCIILGEYYLLTGDDSVLPSLTAYSVALAMGQDAGGLWGHRMASAARNGRLPGYAQINQTSLTCFMGMLMAQKCGVKDPKLAQAIDRTHAFYASFIGKGALNYGVHGPNTKTFNNNGTSASLALDMALKGDAKGAAFFSRLAATSYDGLETGHSTYYFNVLWTPLGASVSGPEVTRQFFKKSRWLHTLYRSWNGGSTFDGGESKSGNSTGSHLLAYCLPRRKLYITGRNADESIWLKGQAATDAVELSRIDYKNKSADELIALFGHAIPQVTRAAVWTLREKKGEFIPRLVKMMKEGSRIEKQNAIGFFGYGCPKEIALARLDDLGAVLRDAREDPEVRAAAAGSLSFLGEPAYRYYQDFLKLIVADEPGDRFGDVDWSVAGSMEALCKDPFKAGLVTDKGLFYKAALKLADNKRQHVRAHAMRMLAGMPLEDFHIVADKVMHVVRDDDPTYHSYHSPGGPVASGITVLANLNIEEGIQCALDINKVQSGKASFKLRAIKDSLGLYGANAKPALEKLKSQPNDAWDAMLKAIADQKPRKLISFEEAKKVGASRVQP